MTAPTLAALKPCPFCGHDTPEFERMGTPRQSCIVICGNCGARHESSDEGDRCGQSWNERASDRAALAAADAAKQQGEAVPDKWEGAEEWMPLAWELCADECGEDACTELVWEGGPVPEPWGDRWLKYEDEAKRLIALVRKHVPGAAPHPAPTAAEPVTPIDSLDLYKTLCDLVAEAGAVDTVIGRPDVLRSRLADLRDKVGALKVAAPAAAAPVKRWPFVETPGEFTSRLHKAWAEFGSLLPAVRHVLIEDPPKLAAPTPQPVQAVPLTEAQIARHLLTASSVPPNSQVMLVSSIRRLLGITGGPEHGK